MIQATVERFLAQESLDTDGVRIGIAVSGGVDSVVLLDVLVKIKQTHDLYVVHIDHRARDESHDDAVFVRDLCDTHGVECGIFTLEDVPEKNKEAFWREQRQNIFAGVSDQQNLACVLTAHHGTDLVETMLFRFIKGAGPSGLSPFDMRTKPLVEVSKQDILDYAKKHDLSWREDTTNTDVQYDRNRIRQNILPELRYITGNLEKVMLRQAKLMHMVNTHLSQSISSIVQNNCVKLSVFLELDPLLKREVLRHLCGGHPSQAEMDDCLRWLEGNPQGNTKKKLCGIYIVYQSGFISGEKNNT